MKSILKQSYSFMAKTLFVLLMLSVSSRGVAQELQEIRVMGDTMVMTMTYIDDNTLLALAYKSVDLRSTMFVQKMNDDGQLLASAMIWSEAFLADTVIPTLTEVFLVPGRDPFFFYLERSIDGGICTFHKATIHENLEVSFEKYSWVGSDVPDGYYGYLPDKTVNVVVGRDGEVVLSYNTKNNGIRIIRFDDAGDIIAERVVDAYPDVDSSHGLVPTPDSLGVRLVKQRADGPYGFSCLTFDTELNIVDTILNVDQLSYPPVSCSEMAYFRFNPYSGRSYSINKWSVPAYNGNPEIYQDILMSVYDENMVQTDYVWGIHTPTINQGGYLYSIGFGSLSDVYMAGGMDGVVPHNLYVAYMDQDLNKYGEIYFQHPSKYLIIKSLVARPGGGCLVSCGGIDDNTHARENCIYKITVSDFLNVKEAHTHGFAVATAYPNPGKDVLNIRTGLRDARVEVYDTNGKLVHSQAITEDLTPIDAAAWASGVYVWKVYTGVSTGSTTEAETGKWVKE